MSAALPENASPREFRGRNQRGAALVIAAILIAVIIAVAVTVAGGLTRSETRDSYHHNDSVEAMMLAETGVEIALWRFGQGAACGSLASAPFNVAQTLVAASGKTFQFTGGAGTGFDGATALSATQCRVQSTGTVGATNVRQVIQSIIDRNLAGGVGNGTFNSPTSAGSTPTNWTGITATNLDDTGGRDCSRALYAFKTSGGAVTNAAATNSVTRFSVTRPATFTINYDYRVNSNTTGNVATVQFTLNPGAFTHTAINHARTFTTPKTVPSKGTYSPCSTGYSGTRGSATISTGGTGTTTITSVLINLNVSGTGTNQREIWLDNVELVDTTAGTRTALGGWRVVTWHDCRIETCP